MQPDDTHVARGARGPAASTDATTAASSSGGSVFGITTTAVNPPSAAARAPVSMVSASSSPGSRKCTWRSTRPGATTQPSASSTARACSDAAPAPTSAIDAASTTHVGDPLAGRVDARVRP